MCTLFKFDIVSYIIIYHCRLYYHFGRSLKPGDRLPMSFSQCDIDEFNLPVVQMEEIGSADEIPDYDEDESGDEA